MLNDLAQKLSFLQKPPKRVSIGLGGGYPWPKNYDINDMYISKERDLIGVEWATKERDLGYGDAHQSLVFHIYSVTDILENDPENIKPLYFLEALLFFNGIDRCCRNTNLTKLLPFYDRENPSHKYFFEERELIFALDTDTIIVQIPPLNTYNDIHDEINESLPTREIEFKSLEEEIFKERETIRSELDKALNRMNNFDSNICGTILSFL